MPQTWLINDFSAGWCPSDDPINGRKNGLLRMDDVELDQNGALKLIGGTTTIGTAYSNPAHTISSKFLKDGRYVYVATTDGIIYRANTALTVASGSATRGAFGAAFDYVIGCSGSLRIKDNGTTASNLGITRAGSPAAVLGGGGILNAAYEYVQINVNQNGAYQGKSPCSSASSGSVSPVNQVVTITPAGLDGNTNAWIFRRSTDGGKLGQYYRIANVTSNAAFDDNMSDADALTLGIILDTKALTVNSTDLPDDILEVVGPINGRILYFTKNAVNFSEANSPDSYSPGQTIYFAGGPTGAEMFLFARKISDNLVMMGTTRDYYLLGGTFVTQPDGTLDARIRSLTVENPPISIDADVYQNQVIAMTAAGWKLTAADGSQTKITDQRTDRLYRGETIGPYGGVPILILPQYRYSCCVVREKLYVRVPQIVGNNPANAFTYRMEVYDFKRDYWRSSGLNPLMIFGQEDDTVIGFFGISNKLKQINDPFNNLNDGVALNPNLTFSGINFNKPRNRTDIYNIKFGIDTGNAAMQINIYDITGTNLLHTYSITANGYTEITLDVYEEIGTRKGIMINMAGNLPSFILTDISVDYDLRPDQINKLTYIAKWGPNKKRVRTLPFKIDNLSTDVTCTPTIDGAAGSLETFGAANYEKTFLYQFTTDVFGVDYRFKLASTGLFELYEIGNPDISETLPIAKRFEQLGPLELTRYGIIKEFEARIIAFGGTTIPYAIYIDDIQLDANNLIVVDGKESMPFINIPATVAGEILRIELGPTNFDFHIFFGRVKAQKLGKDTEIEYIELTPASQQQVGS